MAQISVNVTYENEDVILVDEDNNKIGTAGTMKAHQEGLRHRAISVIILNSKYELLLQQRAFQKYHSDGLWANACCSHPRPGEVNIDAAHRRLAEEMGLACDLNSAMSKSYSVEVSNNLIENEIAHIYLGRTDSMPDPNPAEVYDWCWMPVDQLEAELSSHRGKFSEWLRIYCHTQPSIISPNIMAALVE